MIFTSANGRLEEISFNQYWAENNYPIHELDLKQPERIGYRKQSLIIWLKLNFYITG